MSDLTDDISNNDNSEQDQGAEATPVSPPGQRLREAREAQGVTREDVAGELRLDTCIIEALEYGDTARLPQPVFTAGYLRSYARFIGLPPDELVTQFMASVSGKKTDTAVVKDSVRTPNRYRQIAASLPRNFSLSASRNLQHSNYRVQAALLAGIVMVILISWLSARWFSGDNVSQDPVQATDSVASAPRPEFVSPESAVTGKSLKQGSDRDSMMAKTEATTTSKESTPGAELQRDKPVAQDVITRPLALKPLGSSDMIASDAGAANSTDTGVPSKVAELTELELKFSDNSWVDIRDSTGKRLIRDLGARGDTRRVSGVAPFQVLLGYGPGVKIEYNGTPYDFSEHQGEKIARFTLEVPGDEEADDGNSRTFLPESEAGLDEI